MTSGAPLPSARARREPRTVPDVDWASLEAYLREVPESFRQPRFASLPHVLEVLSSEDPQSCLEALRERRERLDMAVDEVVRSYHAGFSQAIHNYAQILGRFSEAQAAANKIRRSLGDCASQADVRLAPLRRIYGKSITIADVTRFLDEIQSVHGVPARLEALVQRNDFRGAADVLVDASNTLQRNEMQRVEGLKELREGVDKQRQALRDRLVDEIHERIYGEATLRSGAGSSSDSSDEEEPLNGQFSAVTPQRNRSTDKLKLLGERTLSRRRSRNVRHSRTISVSFTEGGIFNQAADDSLALCAVDVEELIECLSRLGELEVGKEELIRRVQVETGGVIQEEIDYWLPKIAKDLQDLKAPDSDSPFLSQRLQEEIRDFAALIFTSCRIVLSSLLGVLRRIIERGKDAPGMPKQDPKEELLAAAHQVWNGMEEELWTFLTAFAGVRVHEDREAIDSNQGTKTSWLWRQTAAAPAPAGSEQRQSSLLTFSFDINIDVDLAEDSEMPTNEEANLKDEGVVEVQRYSKLKNCGITTVYALACVYRPVVEFSQIAMQTISKALIAFGIDSEQVSSRLTVGGLKDKLTKYAEEHLLATLLLDHNKKCTDVLAKLSQCGHSTNSSGRRILEGDMELHLWASTKLRKQFDSLRTLASSIPIFAKDSANIAGSLLKQVEEAVEMLVISTTKGCLAYQLMAKEEVMDMMDQATDAWIKHEQGLPSTTITRLLELVSEEAGGNLLLLGSGGGSATLIAGGGLLLQLVTSSSVRRMAKLSQQLAASVDRVTLTVMRMLQSFFVDLVVTIVHFLHPLRERTHLLESEEGALETSLPVMHLCKVFVDLQDSIAFLPPDVYSSIFSDVSFAVSSELIRCSERMKAINRPGIRQVSSDCSLLERSLLDLVVSESCRRRVRKELSRASGYYELLEQPGEVSVSLARGNPTLYDKEQFLRLLRISSAGRYVSESDRSSMRTILEREP